MNPNMNDTSSRHVWGWVAVCLCAFLPLDSRAQGLEQLIATALASHPSAQGQRALVQSAEAGVDTARWQFYPTPSVSVDSVNASAADRLYQGDNRVSTLRLQQPLWTGGRLSAGMDKAAAGLVVSQASLEEVRLQLGLRVVQTYGDWFADYRGGEIPQADHHRRGAARRG
jgi:outer membrane protein, adhesin transport system